MLKAENLVLHVEDNGTEKCPLDHISFQVDDGEMLVITGPNGGGKSTLAKVLIEIEGGERKDLFKRGGYPGLRYQPPCECRDRLRVPATAEI